jgi:hypothetical protein
MRLLLFAYQKPDLVCRQERSPQGTHAWEGGPVSWEEELFAYLDDLEAQAETLYDAERAAELADRSRSEYAQVNLAARLMASTGREVTLEVLGVGPVVGTLDRVATGWCVVGAARQDWVVRLAAVTGVRGASERAQPEVAWPPVARLGLGSALRRLADGAERCTLHLIDGRRADGVLRRVGADFAELARGEAEQVELVSLERLAAVQSRR